MTRWYLTYALVSAAFVAVTVFLWWLVVHVEQAAERRREAKHAQLVTVWRLALGLTYEQQQRLVHDWLLTRACGYDGWDLDIAEQAIGMARGE